MLDAIYNWTVDPRHRWRSWVGHTLMVVSIACLFGPAVALFAYWFREAEQAAMKKLSGQKIDWTDAIMDAAVPMWALAIMSWLGWG